MPLVRGVPSRRVGCREFPRTPGAPRRRPPDLKIRFILGAAAAGRIWRPESK